MRFDIITIFPEAFASYLNASILKRAKDRRLIDVHIHNLRDFAAGKHKSGALRQAQGNREPRRTIDAPPYGGGPGMVFKLEPLAKAFLSLKAKPKNTHVILFHASGKQFNQKMAGEWSKKYKRLIMIAGHYEGVDERIFKVLQATGYRLQAISVGPYVLTGGELPAMIVIDAVSRHIPGVLGKAESLEEKRYGVGVPVYTRPEIFTWHRKKYRVPKVLLSGNHREIEKWRKGPLKKS